MEYTQIETAWVAKYSETGDSSLFPAPQLPQQLRVPLIRLPLPINLYHVFVSVFQQPERRHDSGLHRRCGPQLPALVVFPETPAEVVVGNVKGDGCGMVVEFLREVESKPGGPFQERPDSQVVTIKRDIPIVYRSFGRTV